MPQKTWVVGEEVLAADFNLYVQQQVVATFATNAARSTAVPAPVEGMVTWVADRNALEVYDGIAWTSANAGRRIAYAAVTADDVTQGQTTKVGTVSFSLAATRLVKAEAVNWYTMVTGSSNGNTHCRIGFDNVPAGYFAATHGAPVGGIFGGATFAWASLAAGTHTVDLWAINLASTGCAMRVLAGAGHVSAFDYG